MKLKFFVFSLILWLHSAKAARILALLKAEARSHFYFHEALFRSVVAAGHEVTIVSPFTTNTHLENFTFIQMPAVGDDKVNTINSNQSIFDRSEVECEKIMRTPFIQNLLKSPKNRFDVVFMEQFIVYECLLPIAEKLDVPIIGTFSAFSLSMVDFYHGNPCNPSVCPILVCNFGLKMTFFQRLQNAYYYLIDTYHREILIKRRLKRFYNKYFPTFDLEKFRKITLTFLNTSPAFIPRPMVPNIINVGGIHVEMATKQKIPGNIQKFIDEAPQGVILLSLGSVVGGSALKTRLRAAFRDAFAQIPQRVIWKLDEVIPGLSDNVLMSKWLPQREILAHPNVVAFISHCGAMSTFEAIHFGKPMILIPVFADQPSTAARLAELDVGILLDFATFTKDELVKSIKEITNNPKYTQNMCKLSDTVKDLPTSPSKSIVYWTEYVLRHNGAGHLRTVGADMPFYQYLLLDVITFVVTVFIVSLSVIIYLCKKIYKGVISTKKISRVGDNKKEE